MVTPPNPFYFCIMFKLKEISQNTKQAATRQGSLWSGTSYKTLIHNIGKLIFNIFQCNHKYFPPVKKAVSKYRIFYTCSKLIHSHSIVKLYSTYSHSIVISYLYHSHQSVVHRSSVGGQIVVRQSGYTKLISYIYVHIPFDNLNLVPQYLPRPPT